MATFEAGQFRIGLVGTQAQEMLFKPVFFDAEIEDIFETMVLVNNKQQIGYVGAMEDIMQLAGGCGWTPKGNLGLFERCIEVDEVKVNLELCYDEFVGTVYKQKMPPPPPRYRAAPALTAGCMFSSNAPLLVLHATIA